MQLKALQHELACTEAVLKVKVSELEVNYQRGFNECLFVTDKITCFSEVCRCALITAKE